MAGATSARHRASSHRAIVLTFVLGVICIAGGAAQTLRTASVSGQIESPSAEEITVAADAGGELRGYFTLRLKHGSVSIAGGDWVLVRRQLDAEGSETELGMLEGSVTGGRLTVGADGSVTGVTSADLTIDSGTGDFETVTTGSGTFEATRSGNSVTGTLKLTF